jgi:hypothetical protein
MARVKAMTGLLILAGALLGAAQYPTPAGYLAPGLETTGGMRHLCLLYHGQARRGHWTRETLRPYVACIDAEGKPTDWLFDSFLFIEFATDDNKQLFHFAKGKPQPTVVDWQWLADAWFREQSGVNGLEQCVAEVGQTLNQPDHRVNVMITLPVPADENTGFGALPGTDRPLDFSQETDRQAALRWYIDTVRKRFDDGHYAHLNLLGFYWTGESIPQQDSAIVRWTSEYLHGQGLKHYWIPYFTAEGAGEWRTLGFDAMMLQPNFFFEGNGGAGRLGRAADRARRFGCGVEMEFDGRALTSDAHLQRFWDYLDAGVAYGWIRGSLVGWYEGGGALGALLKQPDKYRPLYDAICQFVKGTYTPRHPERFPALESAPSRQQDNLALASKGAKVIGAIDNGKPGLAPERMIDGDADDYSGSSGLTWFGIPGNATVELPQAATVARTQMLLFDLDDRFYSYRIDTSADGTNWEPAVDKSAVEARGWQVDRFSPRNAKYIRLTGVRNSTGQNLMQVIEFEAYGETQRNGL